MEKSDNMSIMQSLIIASKNPSDQERLVKEICNDFKIDSFDIYWFSPDFTEKESVGIEDIRKIQQKIFLKPIKSKTKAIVIQKAQSLTPEAQNALLKTLEEPPQNTLIILALENQNLLLPTILSRCKIIEVKSERKPKDLKFLNTSFLLFTKGSVCEKLKLAQDLTKNKETALSWTEDIILYLRGKIIEDIKRQEKILASLYLDYLRSFQKVHILIKTTNVSSRLILENLFLSL